MASESEPAPEGGSTHYAYCASGALRRVRDPLGNTTEILYDELGRRILLDDPSSGMEGYQYDAWDQLRVRTDAAENETTHEHDLLGRETSRVERLPDGSTRKLSWEWDTGRDGDGDLVLGGLAVARTTDGVVDTYEYDARPRASGIVRDVAGQSLRLAIERDALGRLSTVEYPTVTADLTFQVGYSYDDVSGEVTEVTGGGASIWRLVAEDPHGLPAAEQLGTIQRKTAHSATGRVQEISATSGATRLQELAYSYDSRGLLRTRSDGLASTAETFDHDGLGRLTGVTRTAPAGASSASYEPDMLGNLTSTHDSRTEYADGHHPMWATSLSTESGSEDIKTDDAGRITSIGAQQFRWNADDLPRSIEDPDAGTVSFEYAPNGERARKSGRAETLYLGGLFEREQSGLTMVERYYVATPAGVVAVYERRSGPDGKDEGIRWLLADRQGSVETEWDEGRAAPVHIRYDAYGGVLDSAGSVSGDRPAGDVSAGYTGHEHDGDLGLVNMNGRIYEPRLRRFLTADPLATVPRGQGLNRYAYVLNAPMDFTDPSGWGIEEHTATRQEDGIVAISAFHMVGRAGALGSPSGEASTGSGAPDTSGTSGSDAPESETAASGATGTASPEQVTGAVAGFDRFLDTLGGDLGLHASPNPGDWSSPPGAVINLLAATGQEFVRMYGEFFRAGNYDPSARDWAAALLRRDAARASQFWLDLNSHDAGSMATADAAAHVASTVIMALPAVFSGGALAEGAAVDGAAGRTFVSTDPYVGDLANEIEAAYPGHVVGVNVPVFLASGEMATDLDIVLQNCVIQVKSGPGRRMVGQMARTEAVTSLPVIAYGPDLAAGMVRDIRRAGGLVTTDMRLLIAVVAP